MMILIDVIIPTRNRKNILLKVLPTYLKQKYLNKVIIVDDAGEDNLKEEIEKINDPRILYIRLEERKYLPAVRNIGVKNSTAPYIFMGEDDVFLDDNHFEVLLNKLNGFNADLIAGRRIYLFDNQTFHEAKEFADKDKRSIFSKFPFEAYFERYISEPMEVKYLHSNALIKREVFNVVLYDEWYKGNAFREELDFYLRCLDAGFKMVLVPDVVCYHLKSKDNRTGGARTYRLIYEYYVWKNTIYCFRKNNKILSKHFNIKFPLLFAIIALFFRYPYALYRRLSWKLKKLYIRVW
jgi:glycosyltransferase involved in cell wall biosynthesis